MKCKEFEKIKANEDLFILFSNFLYLLFLLKNLKSYRKKYELLENFMKWWENEFKEAI